MVLRKAATGKGHMLENWHKLDIFPAMSLIDLINVGYCALEKRSNLTSHRQVKIKNTIYVKCVVTCNLRRIKQ